MRVVSDFYFFFSDLQKDFNQWDPLIEGHDENLIPGTNVILLQSAIWPTNPGQIPGASEPSNAERMRWPHIVKPSHILSGFKMDIWRLFVSFCT